MVVRYACMACQCGPTGAYFTTYQAAAVHYARSVACHQSLRGIATVVLPNRPANAEAGGSGAAWGWAGPSKLAGGPRARPRPSMTGACTTYHIRFSDMYRMSRIVYEIVSTVYDIGKKPAISHTILVRGGVPRRVLKLLYRSFFLRYRIRYRNPTTISYTYIVYVVGGGGYQEGF